MTDSSGNETELRSVKPGSSETHRHAKGEVIDFSKTIVLPSRRTFNPYFGKNSAGRLDYMHRMGFPAIRTSAVDQFSYRLFTAHENQTTFNEVLGKVLSPVPEWTIDQMDSGQHFLKILSEEISHSSEGLGEGLVSIFFIVDSLYDSSPGDVIVIDEPELSLHPSLQRKLAVLLAEYASKIQIILATHSPYFLSLPMLSNGATGARIHLNNGESKISQLASKKAQKISGLMQNFNNPHIFGLKAQEVFFLEDRVILVEGQEDVIFFDQVQQHIGVNLAGEFFGWGVGGAGNMDIISGILDDLGFKRVVGILDGDKSEIVEELSKKYPSFHFFSIPANDVRTKKARKLAPAIGLLDETNSQVRLEYVEEVTDLFKKANEYLDF